MIALPALTSGSESPAPTPASAAPSDDGAFPALLSALQQTLAASPCSATTSRHTVTAALAGEERTAVAASKIPAPLAIAGAAPERGNPPRPGPSAGNANADAADDSAASLPPLLIAMLPGAPPQDLPPQTAVADADRPANAPLAPAMTGAAPRQSGYDAALPGHITANPTSAVSAAPETIATPAPAADGFSAPAPRHTDATPLLQASPTPPALSHVAVPVTLPAAAPPSPSPALPTLSLAEPPGQQPWQQTLGQHITLLTRSGKQSAELKLHPDNLGQIQITLKLEDNQLQLQMTAAHGAVRSALEAALPVLRAQLAENGIDLGQSSIGQQGEQTSSQHHHGRESPAHQPRVAHDDDTLAIHSAITDPPQGILSVFA